MGKLFRLDCFASTKRLAGGDNVLQYTQTDLDNKVVSLVTGEYVTTTDVTVNSSAGYTKTEVETALKASGLLGSAESLEDFISSHCWGCSICVLQRNVLCRS